MSEAHERVDLDTFPRAVCEFCGGYIEEHGQDCPALEDGRCQP